MVNHYSRNGARIKILLNGVERVNTKLPEDTQLNIRAQEFFVLNAGDTVEYIENEESKVFTVPPNKIWLLEWNLIKKEIQT